MVVCQVLECYKSVQDDLKSGPCADIFAEHLACVQRVGWRDSVKACRSSMAKVQECAVREGLGELKEA